MKSPKAADLRLPKPIVKVGANLPKPDFLKDYSADKKRFTYNQRHDISVSRFRKRYRQLSDAEIMLVDRIKDTAAQLEFLYNLFGQNTNTYEALKGLEVSVMFGVKEATGQPITDAAGEPITVDQVMRLFRRLNKVKAD